MYTYMYIFIYIQSPAGNRATVPDRDQVQAREADQDCVFLDAPGQQKPYFREFLGSILKPLKSFWLPGAPKVAKASQRSPK